MKILELRFKNLNSLYGEWVIDFTHPEYVANGIFLLTGQTGAGKSTVLDAICLALYGSTPRLGKITKNNNEVMSRQTGECYAEVIFSSQAGNFLTHWEQRRANKKTDGAFQEPEHQIAFADTGELIETKKREVPKKVEEKTGMNFNRFTRSVLLAQGHFDSFLKSDIEEKSKILEQITGTQIYSQISQRVHCQKKEAQNQLELLKTEYSAITLLDKTQEQQLEKNLIKKQRCANKLKNNLTTTEKAMSWLINIENLTKEINELLREEITLQKKFELFQPNQQRLQQAQKTLLLEGKYIILDETRKQQLNDQITLETEEKNFSVVKGEVEKQAKLLKFTEQKTIAVKKEFELAIPLIQKIRLLDQKLMTQKQELFKLEEIFQKELKTINDNKLQHSQKLEELIIIQKKQKGIEEYFQNQAQDEALITDLTGIEEQLKNLITKQTEIIQQQNNIKKIVTSIDQINQKYNQAIKEQNKYQQKLEETSKKYQQGEQALKKLLGDRLLREYRTEKDTLLREMFLLSKIIKLEDYRTKLQDGEVCPLCGAKEHPFKQGNVPNPNVTENRIKVLDKLITQAEKQENINQQCKEQVAITHKNFDEKEQSVKIITHDKKNIEYQLTEAKDYLTKLQINFDNLKQKISQQLLPFNIQIIPNNDISILLESLKKRQHQWISQNKLKIENEKQITKINSEIEYLTVIITKQNIVIKEIEQSLANKKSEYAYENEQRKKLYGNKEPDKEEKRQKDIIQNAEKIEKQTQINYSELQQKLIKVKTHIDSLEINIGQRKIKLKELDSDFLSALKTTDFLNEKEFLNARLPHEKQELLLAQAKNLDTCKTELKSRLKDRKNQLANEKAKQLTKKSYSQLKNQFERYQRFLSEFYDRIATYKHQLAENIRIKQQVETKRSVIEKQAQENQRWDKLDNLIGSADGKKYRNFAQGITFKLMVFQANFQLQKMTDRYLLIHDPKLPLELNVVDSYQGGEIRSTNNLSGGESFLVSLALALGLSQMASQKVQVDSLFLDEGFGTLDEETLEPALIALSKLQYTGKIIGIISHVTTLKDKITTQINITSKSNGKSILIGPGVKQNNKDKNIKIK